jgi:hypothetical protein
MKGVLYSFNILASKRSVEFQKNKIKGFESIFLVKCVELDP